MDVYCDMDSAGGGWTLVHSYGFTSTDFNDASAAHTTPMAYYNPSKQSEFYVMWLFPSSQTFLLPDETQNRVKQKTTLKYRYCFCGTNDYESMTYSYLSQKKPKAQNPNFLNEGLKKLLGCIVVLAEGYLL